MIKTAVQILVKNLKSLKMFSLIGVCSSWSGLLVGSGLSYYTNTLHVVCVWNDQKWSLMCICIHEFVYCKWLCFDDRYIDMKCGLGSSVGIVTDYGLDGPDQIPVGMRFSARPDWPWGTPSLL